TFAKTFSGFQELPQVGMDRYTLDSRQLQVRIGDLKRQIFVAASGRTKRREVFKRRRNDPATALRSAGQVTDVRVQINQLVGNWRTSINRRWAMPRSRLATYRPIESPITVSATAATSRRYRRTNLRLRYHISPDRARIGRHSRNARKSSAKASAEA